MGGVPLYPPPRVPPGALRGRVVVSTTDRPASGLTGPPRGRQARLGTDKPALGYLGVCTQALTTIACPAAGPAGPAVSSRGVVGSGHGYNRLLKLAVGARKVN